MRVKGFTIADLVPGGSSVRGRAAVDRPVFAPRGPLAWIGGVLLETEGGRTACMLAAIAAWLYGASAVWPAFGETLRVIGHVAVLYFKTGMRG
jgi:hypothetical protein